MSTQDTCQESVYNELFRTIAPLLRNFLCFKYKNVEGAEDMVQEAFMVLWNNCKKVMPDMAKAYVFRVAQNQMLKIVDKEKVKQKHIPFITKTTDQEDPQYKMEFSEFDLRIQQAIDRLSEGQREVFLLNRVEKKTYNEIAELLDVSVKAVEKRMHKALVKIREIHKNI
ncbi:RNA polymerase sigma factor [Roseivirga misakiensis]|uniref:RNA polymerase subunit sigma-70 n=1 Tax=Roseivirga misakiensis TaxID=1563681 RepID=A0A1E5SZL4_9BACT|nr:sigma-70 family RNA polymerase sigma factor [Roseivirga misakiensis]OEK04563.1 hypothetical protein BFP71_13945 [Roseivirga misakiensis]